MTTATPTTKTTAKTRRLVAPLVFLLGFLLGVAAYGLGDHFVETYVDHSGGLIEKSPGAVGQ